MIACFSTNCTGPYGCGFSEGRNANPFGNYGGIAKRCGITTYHWVNKRRDRATGNVDDWRQCGTEVDIPEFSHYLDQIKQDCAAKCKRT